MRKLAIVAFILLLAIPVIARDPQEQMRPSLVSQSFDALLQQADQNGTVVVIVNINDSTPRRAERADRLVTRAARISALQERRAQVRQIRESKLAEVRQHVEGLGTASEDVKVLYEYEGAPAFSATVTRQGLEALAATPGLIIAPDAIVHVTLAESVPLIKAPSVWNRTINGQPLRGEGQAICILDTGIDYGHPAFTGRIAAGRCFLSSGCANPSDITNASDNDASSHGTHVAGTAAGNATYVGVAPGATIIPVKVCDGSGSCTLSAMTAGVDYCMNLTTTYNISAISLSISDGQRYDSYLACPYDSTTAFFEQRVNDAYAAGVLVPIASGNSGGSTGVGWPACIINATSVGSVTKSDGMSSFTQTGTLLDLLAPGESITAPLRNNAYGAKSGTSMATPHVAGAAALIAQNELLRGRAITPRFIDTVMKSYSTFFVSTFPRINVMEIIIARSTNLTINTTSNTVTSTSGSIKFIGTTDLTDIDRCVNMSQNMIFVNITQCPQFNKNATLQLSNLSFAYTPVPLVNGTVCRDCNVTNYTGGVFLFNVSHFSSYTAGANVNLTVFDDTDTLVRVAYQPLSFRANYTNSTSGVSVNGTGVDCSIRFNTTGTAGSFETMWFNATSRLYEVNRTFASHGNHSYTILCNGTAQLYELLNATDAFNITQDTSGPVVNLTSPANLSTVTSSNFINFNYTVNDNSGSVTNCSLLINGSINSTALAPVLGTNVTINVTLLNASYSWAVQCNDNSNQTGTSGTHFLTVNVGNVAPALKYNLSNYTLLEDMNVTINVSAYFNDTDPVTFTSLHNGTLTVLIDNGTGNATVYAPANITGVFSLVFVAYDVLNATSLSNNITINVTPVNDAPTFSGTIAAQSWTQGTNRTEPFDLDDYFTDVDNATLIYAANGTSSITVTINSTSHKVSFSQASSFTGTENVQFNASDGRNTSWSNVITLTVSVAGTSGGGGGGGGGGASTCTNECTPAGPVACAVGGVLTCVTSVEDACLHLALVPCSGTSLCQNKTCVSQQCVPAWSCGEWGVCESGTQKRTCLDRAGCILPTGKPVESQSCAVPATTSEPARPPLESQPTVAENSSNQLTGAHSNDTSAVCGDGQCSITEWCPQDCKSRNLKLPVITVLLGCVAAVFVHHYKAKKPV